jgi:hypothetical protein
MSTPRPTRPFGSPPLIQNFFDPDGTRTEFMEADMADGLPMPMSSAPYYQ